MKERIGIDFFEQTKYPLSESDQLKGLASPPVEPLYDKDWKIIELPSPDNIKLPDFDLRQAVEQRRSLRSFSKQPLSVDELAYLLWCTQGVQKIASVQDASGRITERTIRTVPSAGGRHAFVTYLSINNVDGLPSGLYRYIATEHKLAEIKLDDAFGKAVALACVNQTWMANAAAVFLWVANTPRMTWRYVERGYRYMLLDAGHVCQNFYLCAEAIGSGACGIAAYDDDAVNELLGLDGTEQFVIYIATVGKKLA